MSAPAGSRPSPYAARDQQAMAAAWGGLFAVAAAIGIGRFVYTPILPPMAEALRLSNADAGWIASANFLGYLIGALLAAVPTLPGSRRAWVLGSLGVSAMTTAAMGVTRSLPCFLWLRFAGGAASAFVLVIASAMVFAHLAEARKDRWSALHFAGVGTGIAMSAGLVACVLGSGGSWQSMWLASGVLSLVALLAVTALLPDCSVPAPTNRPAGATDRKFPWLVAAYGLFGFGYVITATFLVAIVRSTPAVRALEPEIWMVFGLAAAPSVVLWSRAAARLGIPTAYALACAVEAAGVLASVVLPSALGVLLAATLVGGTFMGLTALGLVRARTLAAGDPRRVLAAMTVAFGAGQIVGPPLAGMLSDRLGSFTVPSVIAVIALFIAAALACR